MKNVTMDKQPETIALPVIPRDTWPQHENYPGYCGLLRAHDSFREVSAYLLEKSEGADALSIGNLIFLFLRWKQAMKNHEAYEERRLYPYLAQKYGISFQGLETQHEELGRLERKVLSAWGDGDTDGVRGALAEHDDVLISHLREEEDSVIPLILSFTPDEYATYC